MINRGDDQCRYNMAQCVPMMRTMLLTGQWGEWRQISEAQYDRIFDELEEDLDKVLAAPTLVQRRQSFVTVAQKRAEAIRQRWSMYPEPGERMTVAIDGDDWEVGGLGIEDEVRQIAALDRLDERELVPVTVPNLPAKIASDN